MRSEIEKGRAIILTTALLIKKKVIYIYIAKSVHRILNDPLKCLEILRHGLRGTAPLTSHCIMLHICGSQVYRCDLHNSL